MKKFVLFFVLFSIVFVCINGFASEKGAKLIIGVKEAPPFVIFDRDKIVGVSIDLWSEVANSLGIEYEFRKYNLEGLLNSVETGAVDLSINPLTVTAERLNRFDFTQPFYITNLGIAMRIEADSGLMSYIKNLFSYDFIKAVFLLLLIVFIFGFVLWLVERKRNTEHFNDGIKGIGDGIWWSAVTMTTVGYGDKAPKTGLGRTISVIWMFTAVILISSFTAGIASALTVNKLESNIKSLEDLRKVKVGTVALSSSASFLREYGISFSPYADVMPGLNDVKDGKIKAFVFDEAILRYMIRQDKLNENLFILPSSYSKEYFSFSSHDEQLLNRINPELIRVIESKEWRGILAKYNLEYPK
jgi:polar amino acid transport system substrate-binding protein